MISYKQWQLINENFGYTLGLKSTQSLGVIGAHAYDAESLEEAKKKKMLAGNDDMADDDDDETGDGEVVPPSSKKDLPRKDKDDDRDDRDEDDNDGDEEDDDDGDEENDRGLPPKPMFSKKKMSKDGKCSVCKCDPCKCSKKDKKKQEWLEEFKKDFMADLKKSQGQGRPEYSDGWEGYKEDALLLAFGDQTDEVPQPGEIGYAPTGRIGEFQPSEVPEMDTIDYNTVVENLNVQKKKK